MNIERGSAKQAKAGETEGRSPPFGEEQSKSYCHAVVGGRKFASSGASWDGIDRSDE